MAIDPGVMMVVEGGNTAVAAEHGVGRAEAHLADDTMRGDRVTVNLIVVVPETRLKPSPQSNH